MTTTTTQQSAMSAEDFRRGFSSWFQAAFCCCLATPKGQQPQMEMVVNTAESYEQDPGTPVIDPRFLAAKTAVLQDPYNPSPSGTEESPTSASSPTYRDDFSSIVLPPVVLPTQHIHTSEVHEVQYAQYAGQPMPTADGYTFGVNTLQPQAILQQAYAQGLIPPPGSQQASNGQNNGYNGQNNGQNNGYNGQNNG
eukprot:Platyproteum_vivax@DN2326_c0_g1_i1.p1